MNKFFRKIALTTMSAVALTGVGLTAFQPQVEAAEKIKINYWHVNADTQGGKTVTELVKEFNESQDEIEVVATFNPNMYKGLMQNMQASVAGGESPDVVQIGWAFVDYFSKNFEYNEPQTVIDQFDKENKDYIKENFSPNLSDLAKSPDGKQIGLPYSLSNPVLYINKDMLKEAGLDENGPKTWKEVQEFAKTIKDKTGKYGFYLQQPADNWGTQALLESNGAQFITDGKASFASAEGKEAYALWADMVLKDKSAVNMPWDQGIQSFIQGDVAMMYTTIAQRSNIQTNAKFNVATVSSPEWEGKDVKIPTGGAMLVMTSKDDKKKEATWKFMKFLYEDASVAKWTEGTGYVPATISGKDSEEMKKFLEENQMMKPALDQMDKMGRWASFPGDAGLKAEQLLIDMRESILTGKEPVDKALDKTQEEINGLIKE